MKFLNLNSGAGFVKAIRNATMPASFGLGALENDAYRAVDIDPVEIAKLNALGHAR